MQDDPALVELVEMTEALRSRNVTIERRNKLVPLTDTELRAIRPPATGRLVIRDPACRGLALRISAPSQRHPSGGRTWSLELKAQGQQRRFTIGPYPDVGLAEARKRAGKLRAEVLDGRDPVAEKKAARKAAAAARRQAAMQRAGAGVGKTIEGMLDDFERLKARPAGLRSWPAQRKMIEANFRLYLGTAPAELTHADILGVLDAGVSRNAPISGKRAVRYLGRVYRWAVGRKELAVNPIAGLDLDDLTRDEPERQRMLSDDEIRALWKASQGVGVFGDLARLFLMTGLRRDELAAAEHSDLDGDVLLIGKTKSGQPHRLPLPSAAIAIIQEQPRRNGQKHIFTSTMGTPVASPATSWHRERLRLQRASGTSGWTWHDLRRTARTLLSRVGVDELVAELIVNHALSTKLKRTYNLYRFEKEMREALERLAAHLEEIVAGRANVVALPPRRAAG